MIASRAEGSLNGMQYTVEIGSGARILVVTDLTEIKINDFVNVEQAGAGTANVRRVSSALWDAVAGVVVETDIRELMTESAELCLAAKDRLLDAESEAQIEAAIRRVKILRDD